MLEREPDLAACRGALERAAQGRGGFLVIEGPAGIGKTALLRASSMRRRNSDFAS